jgi:hypothetical protein
MRPKLNWHRADMFVELVNEAGWLRRPYFVGSSGKAWVQRIGSGYNYFPSHSLNSVIRSPLTNTSCFDFGVRSSLSLPAENV